MQEQEQTESPAVAGFQEERRRRVSSPLACWLREARWPAAESYLDSSPPRHHTRLTGRGERQSHRRKSISTKSTQGYDAPGCGMGSALYQASSSTPL